ncbi:MAG: hypothetical protein MUC92_03550 [Fimbriimonadaceae bacterium]|nr:hypothetical protein [Fimbriimonadaceae bacterium]
MATLPQSHPVTKLTQEIASSFGSQPPRIILSSSSLVPSPCRVNSWGDIFVSPDYLLKYSYKEQAVLLIRAIFLTQLIEYRFWQCFGFLYLGFVFMALTQKSLFLLLGFNLGVAILLGGLFAFVLCLARRQYREKA